jgi:hypothetical protein
MAYVTQCAKCGKPIGFDVEPRRGAVLLCRSCTGGWNEWVASQRGVATGFEVVETEVDHLVPVLCTGDLTAWPELDPRRKG